MRTLPRSRNTDIVVNELGEELLVYDLKTHQAFNLNKTSKIIYQACGDGLTFEELKRKHQFPDDLIYLALDELRKNNLLAEQYASPFAGISRREVIRKVGMASMIALPFIVGITAPVATAAQSVQCLVDSDCPFISLCFAKTCYTDRGNICVYTPKACPGKVCDPRDAVCKECLNNAGCAQGRVCINGDCVTV